MELPRSLIPNVALAAIAMILAVALRVLVVDPQDARRRSVRVPDDVLASPGPDLLRLVTFEYANAWADLVWLAIVQELGERPAAEATASWDRVERWANIAVDLDPRYFAVYYASAVQLVVWAKRAEPADRLLVKGRAYLPERWELPFLLGYNAYFLHGDPIAAAELWETAVPLPDSPRFMPSLAARARFQSGDEAGATLVLETMIDSLDGPQRIDAEIRLKLLKSENRFRIYDEACQRFQKERGRVPKDGAELKAQGYTSEPAEDLLGSPITIDASCRARSELAKVREDEAAQERIGSQK